MNLKTIEIVFENCEVVKIDVEKYFVAFFLSDISENINYYGKDVSKMKFAKKVQLIFGNKCMELKDDLIGDTLLENLNRRDITSIFLVYDDKTKDHIYVPWDNSQDNVNLFQHNKFLKTSVVIDISK